MKPDRDGIDDLLVLARRGALSEGDQRRLREAIASSPEARFLYEAGLAFDAEAPVAAGDEERIERLERQVQRRLRRSGVVHPRRWTWPAVAAVLLVGGVAGGAIEVSKAVSRSREPGAPAAAPPAVATARPGPAFAASPPPAGAVEEPPSRDEAQSAPPAALPTTVRPHAPAEAAAPVRGVAGGPVPVEDGVEPPAASAASPADERADGRQDPQGVSTGSVTPAAPVTALDLFSAANRARVRGDTKGAIALSKELEERFPASSEAVTTHLSLGMLYLQQGQADLALDEFRRYRSVGTGATMPEALWGETQALRQLGRPAEERAALEELLRSYPRSAYRAAAEKRLEALR